MYHPVRPAVLQPAGIGARPPCRGSPQAGSASVDGHAFISR